MPIRQNILRKGKAPKQNLLSFDVVQEESGVLGDLTTSRFFKISEFPSVLPSGNSSFLIEGSNLLKPEVELKEANTIDSEPIGDESQILQVVSISQANYDLITPVATTLYVING